MTSEQAQCCSVGDFVLHRGFLRRIVAIKRRPGDQPLFVLEGLPYLLLKPEDIELPEGRPPARHQKRQDDI